MRSAHPAQPSAQPVLDRKPVDPREFALVIGNKGVVQCQGVRGNEQIVGADRRTRPFEVRSQLAANDIDGWFERENSMLTSAASSCLDKRVQARLSAP
jgi:hypothetical protein